MESLRTPVPGKGKVPVPVFVPRIDEIRPDRRGQVRAWEPDEARQETAAPAARPRSKDEQYTKSPYLFFLLAFALPLVLVVLATVLKDVIG